MKKIEIHQLLFLLVIFISFSFLGAYFLYFIFSECPESESISKSGSVAELQEIIELRGENSKTYDLGNGKNRLVIGGGNQHWKYDYQDPDEQWKEVDLTWDGKYLGTAPYELWVDGKKITFRDRKTGEVSTLELLNTEPAGLDFEIVPYIDRVAFQHTLSADGNIPFEGKFKVTGNPRLIPRAFDEKGELVLETIREGDILIERLSQVKDAETGEKRMAKGQITVDPTLTVQPSIKDNYLNSYSPDTNSGISSIAYAGFQAVAGPRIYRSLFEFPVNWSVDIPSEAIIDNAMFELYVNSVDDSTSYTVARLLRTDWSETQSTWNHYKTDSSWTEVGAGSEGNDFTSTDSVSITINSKGLKTWTVTNLVKTAQSESINVIFRVRGGTESGSTGRRITVVTRQSSAYTVVPKLIIDYRDPNHCPVPIAGDYTVTANCYFDYTYSMVHGVEQGNLTVEEGVTLTIHGGQTIVFNPGQRVSVNGKLAIAQGGRLSVSSLWMEDADNDGYPATTTQRYGREKPEDCPDCKQRHTMATITEVDLDDGNACADSLFPAEDRPCGEADNIAGTCNIINGCKSVCERCIGESVYSIALRTTFDAGMVCADGSFTATKTADAHCDKGIECPGSSTCSATMYYRGCASGGTSCVDTGRTSYGTWNASENHGITQSGWVQNATSCTQSSEQHCSVCKQCDGFGSCDNFLTTNWNDDGGFGCEADKSRCDGSGNCITCGGIIASDNCNGCADQGGPLACWYRSDSGGESCDDVCGERGCVEQQWNDDSSCTVASIFFAEEGVYDPSCNSREFIYAPYITFYNVSEYLVDSGYYRNEGINQLCSEATNSDYHRICVCNY